MMRKRISVRALEMCSITTQIPGGGIIMPLWESRGAEVGGAGRVRSLVCFMKCKGGWAQPFQSWVCQWKDLKIANRRAAHGPHPAALHPSIHSRPEWTKLFVHLLTSSIKLRS